MGSESPQTASALPPAHVLLPPFDAQRPFRFDLGLRRGESAFFQPSREQSAILLERRRWLAESPHRYAALGAGAQETMADASTFAASFTGPPPSGLSGGPLLRWLGAHWEPDFLLLKPQGERYALAAGCVCFPSSWDLTEKLGLDVAAIHQPVPTLNTQLEAQIDAFLSRLKPGSIWQRWNLGLAADAERNRHPARSLPRLEIGAALTGTWLRAEEQAFVRLSGTSTILFGIRIHLRPLICLSLQERHAVANWLEAMPDSVAAYKGLSQARETLVERLKSDMRHTD